MVTISYLVIFTWIWKCFTLLLIMLWFCSEKDFKESASVTHQHSVFYDVVTVLATHVITVAVNNDLCKHSVLSCYDFKLLRTWIILMWFLITVPRQNFPTVCIAAKILCESLLARLQHVLKGTHPILSVKLYINAIQVG